jgi:hypothetical protein
MDLLGPSELLRAWAEDRERCSSFLSALFEQGNVMIESTLTDVVNGVGGQGPVTVLRDFRFPGGESIVIVRPAPPTP